MSAPPPPPETRQPQPAAEDRAAKADQGDETGDGVLSSRDSDKAEPERRERAAPSGTPPAADGDSHIEPDDFDEGDETYPESTTTSYLTSIASDIRRGIQENGRTYGVYGLHKAWMPSDDLEMERNDLQHCKFTMLMGNELHMAPIPDYPQRILDLGTGSGIWAIDMAEKHPSARVIGVDTTLVQPNIVPPNLTFEASSAATLFVVIPVLTPPQIDDIEHDWLWGEATFDFIHARELIMAVRDWPRLMSQAYTHLKPGSYFQLSGSVPDFRSDDGTLPPDSAYVEMGKIYFDMSERVGLSGWEPTRWREHLENAGFEDVVEKVLRIPTNPWPRDKHLKEIGAFELHHFRETIANVFARGYEQILGGDPDYFQVLLAKARQEVLNPNMHSWVPFYVVYGRRPPSSAATDEPEKTKSASQSPES
ncbi:hypothetical protein ACJ41O_001097 [Fusarium nematophilum]